MQKVSAIYNKIADFLDKIVYVIGGSGLIVCAAMCGANILMWWFAGKRIAINDEVSLFGLIWATYIGMGTLFRLNGHCTMDFVVKTLPPKGQAAIRIFTDIIIAAVCVLTVYFSWKLAAKSFNKKLVLTKIPYFYVDISITIGFAHMLMLSIGDMAANIYKLAHWGKE